MTTLAVCIVIGVLTVVVAAAIRGSFVRQTADHNFAAAVRHVDMLALNNLFSQEEEDFLQAALPRSAFKRIRRLRTRAMIEYVSTIAYNAGLALRWSAQAQSSDDPAIVETAKSIGRIALEVRVRALQAICILTVSLVFPNIRSARLFPIQTYARLKAALVASGTLTGEALQIATHL